MAEKNYYSIKNIGNDTAEIFIYEEIGENWYGEGTTAKNFCRDLKALNCANIDLHINSPGGSVFDGQAIYNALKRHPANVTTYVDGLAASIASVIALAGDKVVMAGNSLFMIHNPWGSAAGNSEEMRKYADLLDKVRDTIVNVYKEKCGLSDAEIVAAMDAETWMTAEEAQAFGFIDEIGIELKMAASTRFDFKALGYRNVPQIAAAMATPGCHDSLTMYAQMPCEQCDLAADCSNPNCSMTNMEASAPAEIKPQGAKKAEVVIMSEKTPTPNGAKEAAEIVAMCVANNCADKAAEFISAGATPDQVGRQILDLHASGKLSTPAAEAPGIVDMGKDANKYSYQKALLAAIDIREGKACSGLEVDIHQEIAKRLPQNYSAKGGIFMPMRVNNTALTTGGSTTGAETVFTQYGELIDLLRNTSVLARMGARTLTDLRGPIIFPKQTGASTAYWMGEAGGADVTASNITFGTLTMSPKTMQATGAVSRQLLVQSTPDVEGLVREDIAAVHALGWDRAGLHGTGADNQPSGLYVASGVNAVAMGGVPTYGKLVDMETEINLDNALVQNVGFVTTPGIAGKMRQTLESATAGSRWIWDGSVMDGTMIGYRAVSSNQVSKTLAGGAEHGLILGNFADLLIGMWAGLELLVDPYTLAKQGLVQITSFQMVDIGIRRTESFTKATGATIA